MYCTTFYSYKGGVGRTLALANVAAYLAMRRKKVLIVDFDLEAPGITTLNFCANSRDKPGVVDFIHTYLRESLAPDVTTFIHGCSFQCQESGEEYSLDVMPAGDQSSSYGSNFAKIDWRELYEERDGFLLMEDLREQWVSLGYDYVLIDSRTGLTDVSGICTRQLPDVVVTLFFPNEQNLVGLKEMVESIRQSKARPRCPELLFVASRLPRLDDENGVLERWLTHFQTELSYDERQFRKLEQYDSLALLDQEIFVLCRPKTSLSKQYQRLGSLLSQLDDKDAIGAINYIANISRIGSNKTQNSETMFRESNPFSLVRHFNRLSSIELIHQNDCVVQRRLAEYYFRVRDFTHLEVVLRLGLAAGTQTQVDGEFPSDTVARLYHLQMKLRSEIGEVGGAVDAALDLLKCDSTDERMVVEALMLLVTSVPDRLPEPTQVAYLRKTDIRGYQEVMRKFGISSREAEYNCRMAVYAIDRFGDNFDENMKSIVELALIAGTEFDKALELLGDSTDPLDLTTIDLPNAFNRVMALWGREGSPDIALFIALLEVMANNDEPDGYGANFQQCMGLINAVLGNVDECHSCIDQAKKLLSERLGRREVSCWSFVEEPAAEFILHCDEIWNLAQGQSVVPLFISRSQSR